MSDPFNYADDAEFTGNIDTGELTPAGSPVSGDRDRVLHWASREGLALFEGPPGRKHPLKDYDADGGWGFRRWARRSQGPALARIPADMLILDGDTQAGRIAIEAMPLPPHFAIRSLKSRGEKHFFRMEDPPRRMIGALDGLDILTNPDFKAIWAKIDNGDGGYEVISETEEVPEFPPEVLAAIMRMGGSRAAARPVSGRPAAAGATPADGGKLLPTEYYGLHGIPLREQEDRFYRLADRFAAQGMSEDKGTTLLLAIARVSEQRERGPKGPWTESQLREKMRRALGYIAAQRAGPVPAPHEPQDNTAERETMSGTDDPLIRFAGAAEKTAAAPGADEEEVTDSHLVKMFAREVLRGTYCWVRGWGWMTYRDARIDGERRGSRWFAADGEEIELLARNWLLGQYEAFREDKPNASASASVKKKWEQQLSQSHVVAVAVAARSEVRRQAAEFDRHPDLLNVANGVVDLRTSTLMDHDPALLFTRSTGVAYVPGATHADWARALTALPAGVRSWFQARIGQAATGYMPPDDAVLVNHGSGANGKTTVLMGISCALGDYYVQAPPEALFGDHSQHPTVRMTFRGARFAALEETPDEGRLNSQQIKMLTSPRNTGRLMHQDYDPEGYATTHATMLNTNHEPAVESTDLGTWRRLPMVRYPYTYLKPGQRKVLPTDRKGDPGLRDRIIAGQQGQHEAVLAWMVRGARRWYEAKRVMPRLPARVQADTDAWRNRANLLSEFLPEHLETSTMGCAVEKCVMSVELYRVFAQSVKDRGHKAWSERTFNQRLRDYAAAHGWDIEKKYTKHDKDRLSQPPGGFAMDPPKGYQAWHGLRFRD